MQQFEYKVVPAPRRGEKARGTKTAPDRFALTLAALMNDLGREGWEYLRADTLPCEERVGLTGRTTVFQNMLVFRRVLATVRPEAGAEARLLVEAARPVSVRPAPAERLISDHSAMPQRPSVFRKLMAAAPVGEAPRIALVPSVSDAVGPVGPASGNGLSKA